MGEVLTMSEEQQACTLSDRATYLAFKQKIELVPLAPHSEKLNNPYGVIVVNPGRHPKVDVRHANAFTDLLISERGRRLISGFTVGGEQLYFPAPAHSGK